MDKKKMIRWLVAAALIILIVSVPATYIWGKLAGAVLRWIGLALGIVYLLLNNKYNS